MRCTIIIHWKIQVVIFHFFTQVNIAIRKRLLHRKTSIKQIITTTLNRSKKGLLSLFFKSPLSHSTVLVKCIVEQSGTFPFFSLYKYTFPDGISGLQENLPEHNGSSSVSYYIWIMKCIKNIHNLNACGCKNCGIKP